ncbi:hypothetical protein VTK73DRAFT_5692 [Phialemonium thermophilum]|uniref:Sey1/RHD3-like three-helix bundle domain-containing protein n=1 Tax=Phialemonium thermophilum TaxID=223376 RepID=A0ABR3V0R0_9PEZI
MTILSESKRQDLVVRFKKTADGVYVEAKRSAIGGITQVPLYFYIILLVLGWNEIVMGRFHHSPSFSASSGEDRGLTVSFSLPVLRNPFLFVLILVMAGGSYIAYTLNLLGPMMQMSNAAIQQAVEIGKQRLREFVENSETARQALAMPAKEGDGSSIRLQALDSTGKKKQQEDDDDL